MMQRQSSSLASVSLLFAALLLFACWLAPGHWFPWVSFQNEVLAALAGLLFSASALASRNGPPSWPRASSFLALVALLPAVQFLAGQIAFRSDALLSFLYLAALALAVSAGASWAQADRRKFFDHVFGALLAAGIVSAGMALAQWLNEVPTEFIAWVPPGARVIGNIAQPNHLAALLALGLLGALWFYETGRIGGRALWCAALWFALGMALTRSRMVWLAAAAFAIGWVWLRGRMGLRLSIRSLLIWTLVFGAIVVVLGPVSDIVDAGAPESVANRLQGGGGRLRIWTAMIDGLMQSPWVGYGWSQVSRAGLAGSLTHFTGESMLRQSHSVPLDLLIWNGIPLGLLLIACVVGWWLRQVRSCESAERAVVLAAVSLILLYSLIEFPLESFYFLVPFGLFVGALEGWSAAERPVNAPRAAMGAALGGIAALGAAVAIEYLDVEQASRDGRMLAAGFIGSAVLPKPRLLDEPIEYIRFWRTPARVGMSAEELDWMRKIAGRNPSPPTLLRYATATGLNGKADVASHTLRRLCNMHSAARCDEGRKSWTQLQQNYAALSPIAFPPTPTPP